VIELNEQQRRVVEEQAGRPVEVIDPDTRRTYVLIAQEQYDRVRSMLESEPVSAAPTELSRAVPPGIRCSQEAFWSDLPQLLKQKHLRGLWVCYAGNERIGIARTQAALIQECIRRGLGDDEFDLDVIEPHASPPWESETIEPGGHEVGDGMLNDPPRGAAMPR
jgi:hypothetical protein